MISVSNYPHMLNKWSLNNKVNPNNVSAGSAVKLLWCCELNHEWEARALNIKNGSGCPYCANRKFLKGFNDFLTRFPELLPLYDNEKNGDPENCFATSNTVLFWKCETKLHVYQAEIYRIVGNRRCPYCAGKKVLAGFNDIKSTYPDLAKFWDYERNTVSIEGVSAGSHKNFWWTCGLKGHSFKASVNDIRASNARDRKGCKVCARTVLVKGVNDLLTTYPELEKWWDWDKNDYNPSEVTGSTKNKMWAKCPLGHSWEISIDSVRILTECSVCSGLVVSSGVNDLKSERPDLEQIWDYSNNTISIDTIRPGSTIKVHWICKMGHKWFECPLYVKDKPQPCPYCGNRKLLPGFNDLAAKCPEVKNLWNNLNDKLPDEIVYNTTVEKIIVNCKETESSFITTPYLYTLNPKCRCDKCVKKYRSGLEASVADSLSKIFNNNASYGDRTLIPPYEIDIFYYDFKIAIECNGIYWHSNDVVQRNHGLSSIDYHKKKLELCAREGITLFYIWEDDWAQGNDKLLRLIEEYKANGSIDPILQRLC